MPLLFIVLLSMIKDAFEDKKRHDSVIYFINIFYLDYLINLS